MVRAATATALTVEVFGEFFADPVRMRAEAALIREEFLAAAGTSPVAPAATGAAGSGGRLAPALSQVTVADRRAQRREQVRSRVEGVLGRPLQDSGPDYVLPDGRRVAIYYSKIHDRGETYLGIQNRLRDDDIIVLLLGDEECPEHLVFPLARTLLQYRASFSSAGGDRVVPPIRLNDRAFELWRPSHGLAVSLNDRIGAYHELLSPSARSPSAPAPVGRDYTKDDEDSVPRPAAPGAADPDLVGRGIRAHKHTRNALAEHLIALGLRPLDPTRLDPPFDLAWRQGGVLYVAEVKSLTRENEEHQLRLGLGQLLYYCHLLRKRGEQVIPVLVPELQPRDPEWTELCTMLDICLVCPSDFSVRIRRSAPLPSSS